MRTTRHSSPLSLILSILLIVALVALGYFVWDWMQRGDRADRLETEVTQLRQKAADVIAPDNNAAPADDTTPEPATDDSADGVLDVAKAYEQAQPANQGADLRFEVTKREGDFARVDVNVANGGGHMQILKKVNDEWVVVLAGQQFEQAELQRFGVPATLIQQ